MSSTPLPAATFIQRRLSNFRPTVGIILGSGLGDLVTLIESAQTLAYQDIPGFPQPKVAGHQGQLVSGQLGGVAVVCLQGRSHLYEGTGNTTILTMIHSLHQIGCELLIITNAAGSLRSEMQPGELMLISDHINLQFNNVLVGCFNNDYGSPFISMENAYCRQLRQEFLMLAENIGIILHEGVYMGVLGPSFETPAEIRAFASLGADVVGMSTIPEVIAARYAGMKVAAISVITNLAAGLSQTTLSHELTLANAQLANQKLAKLIINFLQQTYKEKQNQ